MTTAARPHILISGAGVGGLATAISLLQAGFDVDLYEQAAELKGLGAGVQISSNGSRVLCDLGLRQAIEPLAVEAEARLSRLWSTGQIWRRPAKTEPPYWFLHRGDLHQVLVEAVTRLKADAIHLNAQGVGFEQVGERVRLDLADGRRVEGDCLIGADGVHSALRRQMFGPDTDARFTGLAVWRGMAPMEALPEELHAPVGSNWQGPGAHVITYPMHGGRILNFVGAVEDVTWQDESWSALGSIDDCRADFRGWHPLVQAVIDNIGAPYKWALLSRPPMARWAQGRACLIGDACHPTLPFLAQGANMALEDAVVITRCLEAEADPATAFVRFEAARQTRTARIVRGSDDNTARFHNPALGDPEKAVAYMDEQWSAAAVDQRYGWIFEYDARAAPI